MVLVCRVKGLGFRVFKRPFQFFSKFGDLGLLKVWGFRIVSKFGDLGLKFPDLYMSDL